MATARGEPMELLLIGPVGHLSRRQGDPEQGLANEMIYKGFRLMARARRGPVGWVGDLTILLPGGGSPLQGVSQVPRFHQDPRTAIQEAFIEGIQRIDRGQVIQL